MEEKGEMEITWARVMVVSVRASTSLAGPLPLPPMTTACARCSSARFNASREEGSPSTQFTRTEGNMLLFSGKPCHHKGAKVLKRLVRVQNRLVIDRQPLQPFKSANQLNLLEPMCVK